MQQQRLKQQQQALMQQSLYHPGLLAPPQIEPILSGNLPPGFDSSTCRSVYVGNIHPQVTEPLLQEVFSSTGPLEGCKLIRKEKGAYYCKLQTCVGQPIKVKLGIWLGGSSRERIIQRNAAKVPMQDATLSGDQKEKGSLVLDGECRDCENDVTFLDSPWVSGRQSVIAARGPITELFTAVATIAPSEVALWRRRISHRLSRYVACAAREVVLRSGKKWKIISKPQIVNFTGKVIDASKDTLPQGAKKRGAEESSESSHLSIYQLVTSELNRTYLERAIFFRSNPGCRLACEDKFESDVRIQRDKGFGVIRVSPEAYFYSLTIHHRRSGSSTAARVTSPTLRNPVLPGRDCSWGNKPTPPGTSSAPLPPPAAAHMPGFTAADLAAYERQLALSKMSAAQALMNPQAQRLGAATQAIYDSGYSGINTTQPPLYYQ
ncbi:UNVERIFIED_CONTAM: Oligouridylate-binding protein 1 [Sesamum calycinum]|uniref:Oligouridylate-binding protein 1 n=1 Tax=Sesamum calycinum TaxID=2727403 RepID=A0AAW2NWE8_9LAMI